MSQSWRTLWIAAAVAVSTVSVVSAVGLMWKKKKRSFVRVGTVSKLYFFPVKGLKGIEVNTGKCTELGFEVNGLLDRSFMLIDNEGVLMSQKKGPTLALLDVQIDGKTLTITTPSGEKLNVEIKDSPGANDKIVPCRIVHDITKAVDCGNEAASFFQSYLNTPGVRLVRYFPKLIKREYKPKGTGKPFELELRKDNPHLSFQNYTAFHLVSKPSVEDLNSKLQNKTVSEQNFRPNILVDDCKPYAEDSWNYIKFSSGSIICNLTLFKRCLITTNDPNTGVLHVKEPLATLKKYRIPSEPEVLRKTGGNPCLGIGCGVYKIGDITVGDDVFADVGPQPKMTGK
ncbi:mitochondrial amidoxime reducing component 2-like isoform X2 [Argiope bruennichi]|uniref:Mitochondrial amidoxime reducing component 2 like protein n=2 Tax=Argiope bruennichi TaxID=94029 RepID=A0A8T0FTR4_ARGBR|nr:mitochondrial amidoxime reducing component 2-like isoform X2 [Argiope bruennichi]XP_055954127.1 mitochondrial amidoxime reducing component 2-like isoform X2 [Argiope bruennichi]KAF8793675.1 Mitochondrial amidoxime reducing component 2 like protein [Argiope bruennichi]